MADAGHLQWPALDLGAPRPVRRFLAHRLLLLVPTLLGVLVTAFLLLDVAPGDPVQEMVGERADSATVTRLRRELRLDDPLPARFAHYVAGVLRGDLGRSYITRRPIAQDLRERFPKTLQLTIAAMTFATVLGITLGVVAAARPDGVVDRLASLTAYLGVSFPVYWVGLLLILLFAVSVHWLPPSGSGGFSYLILPALTLGMRSVAVLTRMTRGAMRDALASDFIRTARAKGLGDVPILVRHALRNALIPVITVLALDTGNYLTGSLLTESIFSWPGLGRYVLTAIEKRDLPAIQGSILFMSVVFVLVNLVADLLYAKTDPRIAYD
jgi:ABC-type dipeptide/oligopeptide/nickel transport system permease component